MAEDKQFLVGAVPAAGEQSSARRCSALRLIAAFRRAVTALDPIRSRWVALCSMAGGWSAKKNSVPDYDVVAGRGFAVTITDMAARSEWAGIRMRITAAGRDALAAEG